VIGVGGAFIQVSKGGFQISGMALAAIVGVILNLILPHTNDEDADAAEQQNHM
jgi:uracil permease